MILAAFSHHHVIGHDVGQGGLEAAGKVHLQDADGGTERMEEPEQQHDAVQYGSRHGQTRHPKDWAEDGDIQNELGQTGEQRIRGRTEKLQPEDAEAEQGVECRRVSPTVAANEDQRGETREEGRRAEDNAELNQWGEQECDLAAELEQDESGEEQRGAADRG